MPATSQKFKVAEETLPEDLKPVFRRFVDEYKYLTSVHFDVATSPTKSLPIWSSQAGGQVPSVCRAASSDVSRGRLHVLDSRTAVELVIWDIYTGFLADPLPLS